MGIFYSTRREEYHTLFISSVYGVLFYRNAHKKLHSGTLRLIMERNALSGTTASLKTSFELGWGCVQPLVAQCFSPLATGLDDTVNPERALKYGIKLHRRTVAK